MKQISIIMECATGTKTWAPITIPKGWLQYIVFSHSQSLAAGNYYKQGLSNQKREGTFTGDTHVGGMLFIDVIMLIITTSGATQTKTLYEYPLRNLEVKKPKVFYVHLLQNTGSTDIMKVTFFYTEKKLQEVV